MSTRLRLVREDGTPARIDDLMAPPDACMVNIDGVWCWVDRVDGPVPRWDPGSSQGIDIRLSYSMVARDVYDEPHGAPLRRRHTEFDCPFELARRSRREASGPEARRRRERTEYRP